MMKRYEVVSAILAIMLLSSSVLFAQEEGGLIHNIANKFIKQRERPKPVAAAVKKDERPVSGTTAQGAAIATTAKGATTATTAKRPPFPLPREGVIDHIRFELEAMEEIVSVIPGLKALKGDNNKPTYLYQGVRLEDLKDKDLQSLFQKIGQEANKIRTDRLNKQLESIRQAQQAVLNSQQAVRAANASKPFQPPVIQAPPPMPPQPPQPPPQQPQVQRPPQPPPMPPAQPRR